MGASTRGALDNEPGCHQTIRETNQVDWASEVGLSVSKSPNDRRLHVWRGACVPYQLWIMVFHCSVLPGVLMEGRLCPDSWDATGV